MRTKTANQILTAIITTLILISDVNASEDCGKNPDVLKDGQALAQFLVEQTTGRVKDTHSLKVGARLNVVADGSQQNEQIRKLGNEGVIANSEVPSFEDFRNNKIIYGSLVAVSPCHAITNLHVPEGLNADKSCRQYWNNPESYNSCIKQIRGKNINLVGQEYIGSFPKACGKKAETRKYEVVAHIQENKAKLESTGQVHIPVQSDFAILRTSTSLGGGRTYAKLNEGAPVGNHYLLSVGAGRADLDDNNMKFTRVSVGEVRKFTVEGAVVEGVKSSPGKSGSGVYRVKNGQVDLVGFLMNEGNAYVTWYAISQFLRKTGQHEMLAEIETANRTGKCNR